MSFDLSIGRNINKLFLEELIKHCISKEILPIVEDTTITLEHFNKVLKVNNPVEILLPSIEVDGFVFYVKNASEDVIEISPLGSTIEGEETALLVQPGSSVHLSTDGLGNYVLLSTSNNSSSNSGFKILEYAFIADSNKTIGDILDTNIFYTVGNNCISIFSRGAELYRGFEFNELGTEGKKSRQVVLNSNISIGDEVLIRVLDAVDYHIHEANFVATENLHNGTVFTLPDDLHYYVGSNAIKISVRGTEWYRNIHFEELGEIKEISNQIILLGEINIGDEVSIHTIDVGPVCVIGNTSSSTKTIVVESNQEIYDGIIKPGNNSIELPPDIDLTNAQINIYLMGIYQLSSSWRIENGSIVFSEELKKFTVPLSYELVVYYSNKDSVFKDSGVISKSDKIFLSKTCNTQDNYIELYLSGIKQSKDMWHMDSDNSIQLNTPVASSMEYEVLIYPYNVMVNYAGTFKEDGNKIVLPESYFTSDYLINVYVCGLHQRHSTYEIIGNEITIGNVKKNYTYDVVLCPKIGVQKIETNTNTGTSCNCTERLISIQESIKELNSRVEKIESVSEELQQIHTTLDNLKEQIEKDYDHAYTNSDVGSNDFEEKFEKLEDGGIIVVSLPDEDNSI